MTTNDHTVPQMYLRRFAAKRPGNKHFSTVARHIDRPDRPFEAGVHNIASKKDFHLGVDQDGNTTHVAERLMSHIEAHAAPVLNTVLDDHSEAFPRRWPLRRHERVRLAYYIAAQLLRTKRQRRRVNHLLATHTNVTDSGPGAAPEPPPLPDRVRKAAANNPHLAYIAQNLSVLAGLVYLRPWGIGFADACLLTSDTPAVIVGGHDAPDQLAAAAYWDVLLPLDPHRFLLLPGTSTTGPRTETCVDRRLHIPGRIGELLSQIIWDAADQQVYHHPQHCPFDFFTPSGARLPAPDNEDATGGQNPGPEYYLGYAAVPHHLTIGREWLAEHPAPQPQAPPAEPAATAAADQTTDRLAVVRRLSAIVDDRREKAPPAARR